MSEYSLKLEYSFANNDISNVSLRKLRGAQILHSRKQGFQSLGPSC